MLSCNQREALLSAYLFLATKCWHGNPDKASKLIIIQLLSSIIEKYVPCSSMIVENVDLL